MNRREKKLMRRWLLEDKPLGGRKDVKVNNNTYNEGFTSEKKFSKA